MTELKKRRSCILDKKKKIKSLLHFLFVFLMHILVYRIHNIPFPDDINPVLK